MIREMREPLAFELSSEGKRAFRAEKLDVPERKDVLGGRRRPGGDRRLPRALRGRGHPPLHPSVPDELLRGPGILSPGLLHDEIQSQGQRAAGGAPGLHRRPPQRSRRARPGEPAPPQAGRAAPRRDHRHGRVHPPARGRRPRRAHRHDAHPGRPRGAGERPQARPHPRFGPRDEPVERPHLRLRGQGDQVEREGDHRPRGPGPRHERGHGRPDGHQSQYARRLRVGHLPDRRDRPFQGRLPVHGRGQHERPDGHRPAGRHGRRCPPPQPPQDVLDPARRRRARFRPRRREEGAGALPPGPGHRGEGRPVRPGRGQARVHRPGAELLRELPHHRPRPGLHPQPGPRRASGRSPRPRSSTPTTSARAWKAIIT